MTEKSNLVAQIVGAYVANNNLPAAGLADFIHGVHHALSRLGEPAEPPPPTPVIAIAQSVKPGYVVCLECGATRKTLRRHLMIAHGLAPDEYREKWGLDTFYPITAPNYAIERSQLAKSLGLGRAPNGKKKPRDTTSS